MSLAHQNREDETLLSYFKQMLDFEEPVSESEVQETNELSAKISAAETVAANAEAVPLGLKEESAEPAYLLEPKFEEKPKPGPERLPFAEGPSLEKLLSTVDSVSSEALVQESEPETALAEKSVTQTETEQESAVEEVTDTHAKTQSGAEADTETQVQDAALSAGVQDVRLGKALEMAPEASRRVFSEWENIDPGREFQTLFFVVGGVRFAVPLIDLGSIFEKQKLTSIFGQPKWFLGMTDIRGRKINVVDTLRFVKDDFAGREEEYPYIITLGQSRWALTCDVLEGNRTILKDEVKWRQSAGSRPWLAGIVKEQMCALLHVQALIKLFESGFNPRILDKIADLK